MRLLPVTLTLLANHCRIQNANARIAPSPELSTRKRVAWLLIAGVLLFPFARSVDAADRPLLSYSGSPLSRVFVDFQWGIQAVSHSDLDFNPTIASIGAGLWLFDNIGVDVFLDSNISDDRSDAFTVDIDEASGVGFRFQSPARRGLSLHVNLGYVTYRVVQLRQDERGSRTVSETFAGARLGVGVAQRLRSFKNILITGEYRNYLSDDDLQADTLAIGLRVNFK